ncbi:porin [Teredinibacter haidensis]|uniref:porin n=1 Tax=Teredinibacter haidensis TaxID=2731755 RepID=UPI000948C06E|nr:porin [Teredinibacter haidensis]
MNVFLSQFLLTISVLASVASLAQAAETHLYGKVEIELTHADNGVMRQVDKGTNVHSVFSRLGMKGSHPLTDSAKLVYTLEAEVKGFDDENQNQPLTARNTFMGVSSKTFGTLVFGRNDTRFKKTEGSADLFKEREGNLKQIFSGQDRIGDTATYIAPLNRGVKLTATWVFGDDASSQNGDDGYSISATYGDSKLKKRPYYIAAALNHKVKGVDAFRAVGQIDIGAIQLGGLYQKSEKNSEDLSGNGYMVNLALPIGENIAKLQYSYDNSKIQHGEKAKMASIGVDHNFSKAATAYAMATQLELKTEISTALSLGLRYCF